MLYTQNPPKTLSCKSSPIKCASVQRIGLKSKAKLSKLIGRVQRLETLADCPGHLTCDGEYYPERSRRVQTIQARTDRVFSFQQEQAEDSQFEIENRLLRQQNFALNKRFLQFLYIQQTQLRQMDALRQANAKLRRQIDQRKVVKGHKDTKHQSEYNELDDYIVAKKHGRSRSTSKSGCKQKGQHGFIFSHTKQKLCS